MKNFNFASIVGAIALAAASIGSAQAAVFTEDFEGAFPALESNWFGTESNGRNYYCNGALGCTSRGNNPDGLWIISTAGQVSPVEVSFDSVFGASLTSFKLDVAGYSTTTLEAFDMSNTLIFSQNVTLTQGAFTDPGIYSSYTINSTNGISRFTFSGNAAGNTSIDNLVATTDLTPAVPEPETYALMLAGLAAVGFMARRRKSV
jgi:hypothetical protein